MSGYFPHNVDDYVHSGPLQLVWSETSGLCQLGHSFSSDYMYGDNYGYRSGLNASMVQHLQDIARSLEALSDLQNGDYVLDIGRNDATFLNSFSVLNLNKFGIDPSARKFQSFYKADPILCDCFFSADQYFAVASKPSKLITSIAMFYDLNDPIEFAKDIKKMLAHKRHLAFRAILLACHAQNELI
ncbi:conserved hypothetical protein/ similar to the N-terminal part of methyltransferases [Synechococcus sp. RS9909]|nr:conserved hypothetical protein/ similar to the N-terminal part of methyltransferases [Synechococcus sp. RS9909]